jgi:hypothetical protein
VDLPPANDQGRGNTIELEPQWLDFLHGLWRQVKSGEHPRAEGRKHNLVQFGALLAKEIGRDQPFSDASVSRFLKGTQVTDELARAFCQFFSLDYPVLSARHPDEIRWFALGRLMREMNQEQFESLLGQIGQMQKADAELRKTLAGISQPAVLRAKDASLPKKQLPGRRPGPLERDR